ncbi:DUF58 domain-containing protein [Joostella atrarenae]|uniref:DUF58 domain-containing protein n=1 Tax=Joostella atrarenae TaxID=679257 RepID=A0ABS9J599_9FLAO|nr:DUF58 domain-containing protein [Joostella atrarenae]MCF8715560.1 DUF58 domain-containing protein [Joostella atrarenae]
MAKNKEYPQDVFTSLSELMKKEHSARNLNFLSRKHKVNSSLSGKHASKLRGRGLEFEEVRNYVNGDDIRNIDWKVTARTQKTHTRVYTEEKEKPILIVVDQSKSMFFGSKVRTKSVVAAELAAVAAFRVLKEGDRVGGIVFADDGYDVVKPKRSRKNVLNLLEKVVQRNHELKTSKPIEFDSALKDVIQRINNIVTHDFLVVIISDFLRYSPRLIKSIAAISQHNDLVLAKVSDPMENIIPKQKFVAGNTTHQIVIDGKNKATREAFKEGFDTNYYNFQDEMKKYRVPVFMVDTVQPLDDQLREVLGKLSAVK